MIMKNMSKTIKVFGNNRPIVFFGTEDFSVGFLEALIKQGYDIKAVVTKPDTPKGRSQQLLPPAVKVVATKNSIPVYQPASLDSLAQDLVDISTATGVLVSYGKLVPQSIIDIFSPGIINVHPSLLPEYRGPSPIEASILNGDQKTGTTIMQLSSKMDAGPIYHQTSVQLKGDETQASLYKIMMEDGINALLQTLPAIIEGSILPKPQNDTQASYTKLITKSDGELNWQKPAIQLERQIRAYNVWPRSRTKLFGQDVIITKARVAPANSSVAGTVNTDGISFIMIDTADGGLQIDAIQPSGKKEMPVRAFLSGYYKTKQ